MIQLLDLPAELFQQIIGTVVQTAPLYEMYLLRAVNREYYIKAARKQAMLTDPTLFTIEINHELLANTPVQIFQDYDESPLLNWSAWKSDPWMRRHTYLFNSVSPASTTRLPRDIHKSVSAFLDKNLEIRLLNNVVQQKCRYACHRAWAY
jgi:hypothetical protein